VQLYFAGIPFSIQYVRAGKLRALAVTTAKRSEALPDVPTLGDFLPGYEASFWGGFCAPKSTPAEIVDKLNKEINAGLADPKMKARIADLGATVLPSSPAGRRDDVALQLFALASLQECTSANLDDEADEEPFDFADHKDVKATLRFIWERCPTLDVEERAFLEWMNSQKAEWRIKRKALGVRF
jgi:hypothetical protein